MPYCVLCGVELPKGAKACPLCQTEVILPKTENDEGGPSVYPDYMPRRKRPTINMVPSRGFLFLVTFLLALPAIVTFIIDFTSNLTMTWSFYPVASLLLLWILIAYPVVLRGHTLLLVITIDIFAIIIFLLSMDLYSGPFPEWSQYPSAALLLIWIYIAAPLGFSWYRPIAVGIIWFLGTVGFLAAIDGFSGGEEWFFSLGLPITAMLLTIGLLYLLLSKAVPTKKLLIIGITLFLMALFFMGTDALVNLYTTNRVDLTWSPISSAVLIPTSVFLFLVNGNADFKAYLAKKFHV